MQQILIGFFISACLMFSKSLAAQNMVWDKSETIGLTPAKDWFNNPNGDELQVTLKAPAFSGYPIKGNLGITKVLVYDWPLEQAWKDYVLQSLGELNEFEKIEEGTSEINGNKAKWIQFYNQDQGLKFQDLTVVFMEGDEMVIITCTSVPKYYSKIEGDFWSMIKSIQTKKS